jgi:hypothetical protein
LPRLLAEISLSTLVFQRRLSVHVRKRQCRFTFETTRHRIIDHKWSFVITIIVIVERLRTDRCQQLK